MWVIKLLVGCFDVGFVLRFGLGNVAAFYLDFSVSPRGWAFVLMGVWVIWVQVWTFIFFKSWAGGTVALVWGWIGFSIFGLWHNFRLDFSHSFTRMLATTNVQTLKRSPKINPALSNPAQLSWPYPHSLPFRPK